MTEEERADKKRRLNERKTSIISSIASLEGDIMRKRDSGKDVSSEEKASSDFQNELNEIDRQLNELGPA